MDNPNIILASGSQTRQKMLKNAGINFDINPANIDEETILKSMNENNFSVEDIALKLSEKKSLSINIKDKYIIGSDQVLSLDNKLFSKAKNKKAVKERLREFSNQTHQLTSAICVSKNNKIIWKNCQTAHLKMKKLDDLDIDNYINNAGDDIYNCVGCYALEKTGIRLFEEIQGDYFTILGMPLLPLLNFLEEEGAIL